MISVKTLGCGAVTAVKDDTAISKRPHSAYPRRRANATCPLLPLGRIPPLLAPTDVVVPEMLTAWRATPPRAKLRSIYMIFLSYTYF